MNGSGVIHFILIYIATKKTAIYGEILMLNQSHVVLNEG